MASDTSDRHEYSSLVDEKEECGELDWTTRRQPSRRSWPALIWLATPWFLTACCMSLITVWSFSKPTELECTRLLNPYCEISQIFAVVDRADSLSAPVIEQDVIEYYSADFANSFAHETKYRGPPTPELDMAWDQLWDRTASPCQLCVLVPLLTSFQAALLKYPFKMSES